MAARVGTEAVHARAERHGEKVRFLLVGAWNTLFSYGMLWILDSSLRGLMHYSLILTLNWIIGITHNLFTFKILVFRTEGNWFREYARSYLVYVAVFAANLAVVSAIVETWHVRLGIAQLPALVVTTLLSYFGHKYFTYRTESRPRRTGEAEV